MAELRNPITDWLLNEAWKIPDQGDLTRELALFMCAQSIPVDRIRLTVRLLHPQVMGFNFTWKKGVDEIECFEAGHDLKETALYRNSPFAAIFEEKAGAIRRKLCDDNCLLDYSVLPEFKADGYTDYVALPLDFSDGRRSAITLASKTQGGFSTQSLSLIYDCLPALARIVENYALRHTASVLLQTYLGRETGNHVLSGKVKRGDGQVIRCIIWFSDMRQSTTLAETMDSEEFLNLLNSYFECTAGAVLANGGEVLRYVGDAVLAIFPIGETQTCQVTHQAALNAEQAIRHSFNRLELLNEKQRQAGRPEVASGIGIHVGEVMYGNIGTPDRLEFSVIGSSANEASRVESMTKELGVPVVVSEDFCILHQGNWRSLGSYHLKGFKNKRELFTLVP